MLPISRQRGVGLPRGTHREIEVPLLGAIREVVRPQANGIGRARLVIRAGIVRIRLTVLNPAECDLRGPIRRTGHHRPVQETLNRRCESVWAHSCDHLAVANIRRPDIDPQPQERRRQRHHCTDCKDCPQRCPADKAAMAGVATTPPRLPPVLRMAVAVIVSAGAMRMVPDQKGPSRSSHQPKARHNAATDT